MDCAELGDTPKSRSSRNSAVALEGGKDPFDGHEQLFPFVIGGHEASAAFCRKLMRLPVGAVACTNVVAGMASVDAIAPPCRGSVAGRSCFPRAARG